MLGPKSQIVVYMDPLEFTVYVHYYRSSNKAHIESKDKPKAYIRMHGQKRIIQVTGLLALYELQSKLAISPAIGHTMVPYITNLSGVQTAAHKVVA